jgi:hypothetical protein
MMVYMYAVPRALPEYEGLTFDGRVVYEDHEVPIPHTAVDETFTTNLTALIGRIASRAPARKVPSDMECGFCNIPSAECPERVGGDTMRTVDTSDF